jgi:hypothetical protein
VSEQKAFDWISLSCTRAREEEREKERGRVEKGESEAR